MRRILSTPVAVILAGTLIGQGTLLAVSPLLSRLYSPVDFGLLAIVTAMGAILGGLSSLAWESAVPIAPDGHSARALVRLGLITVAATTVIVAVASFAGRELLAAALRNPDVAHFWWLIPLTSGSVALFAVLSSQVVRAQHYRTLAIRNGAQGVAQATSSVVLGLLGLAPVGLASSLAVGRLSGSALLGFGASRGYSSGGAPITFKDLQTAARRFRRFPSLTAPSRLINALGLQLPILIMAGAYGAVEVGLFALTARVLASPVGMLADAVAQYFEGALGQMIRNRSGGATRLVVTVVGRLTAVSVPPVILFALAAPAIFGWVFGERWIPAGELAQILVFAYGAQLIASPVSRALPLLEAQGRQFAWDVARGVGTAVAVAVPAALGLSFALAILVLAAVHIAAYLALLALVIGSARGADEATLRA